MKVLNICAEDLKPGMVLYEDIVSDAGATILTSETLIDEQLIEKISKYKLGKVKIKIVEGPEDIDAEPLNIVTVLDHVKANTFKQKYEEKVEEVTYTLKQIGKGEFVAIEQIKNISKEVMAKFDTASETLNYLNLVRPIDDYTYAHSLNVSLISIVIARWLKLDEAYIDELATAALLHDIGKTMISESILAKQDKLTHEEFEIIKTHTTKGYQLLKNVKNTTNMILQGCLMHHEKIDGSGYPFGMTENKIPLTARIIAVADIYDAMTSDRTYREKLCPFEVIRNLEMQTYGKLDTKVLHTFLSNIASVYVNDFVELSNGEIAQIIFINPNRVWQPIVKSGSHFIDLSATELYIKNII